MIYLAAPYSDPDQSVTDYRMIEVNRCFARMFREGKLVFSALSMTHQAAKLHDLPGDAETWARYNMAFLHNCTEMYVLCLPGWRESKGVRQEIIWAKSLGIPITFIDEFGHTVALDISL